MSQLPPESQLFPDPEQRPPGSVVGQSNILRIGAFILIAILFVTGLGFVLIKLQQDHVPDQPVIIEGNSNPVKVRPEQPGGQDIPYQDVTIYEKVTSNAADQPKTLERMPLDIKPPEEVAPVAGPDPAPGPAQAATSEPKVEVAPPTPAKQAEPAKPAPSPPEQKHNEKPKTEPKSEKAEAVNTAPVRVQIAAFPDKAKATGELARIQRRLSGVLGKTNLKIVEANVAGKGVYYRIQSATIAANQAEKLCVKVKAAGLGCFLVK